MTRPTPESIALAGITGPEASHILERYDVLAAGRDAPFAWRRISRDLLTPQHPHALHRLLYDAVFASWSASSGPRPAWTPTDDEVAATHIAEACRRRVRG